MKLLENSIQHLIDRSEIMSVLCFKSSVFWFQLKMVFSIPLIFTSSAMVILNSYFKNNDDVKMDLPNIIVNSINVLMMTSMNMLKIVEKAEYFKQKANDFLELSHQIEASRSIDQLNNEKLKTLQEKYDMLISSCIVESIPEQFKKNVKTIFEGNKTLPIICNGMLGGINNSV